MVGREKLTDKGGEAIASLLPTNDKGRGWHSHRRVIAGILRKSGTGALWGVPLYLFIGSKRSLVAGPGMADLPCH